MMEGLGRVIKPPCVAVVVVSTVFFFFYSRTLDHEGLASRLTLALTLALPSKALP